MVSRTCGPKTGKFYVRKTTESRMFFDQLCVEVATWKCSLKIATPSYFYMQRDISHNFSGVLEKCLWGSLFLFLVTLQANKLRLCWKDIISQLFFKYFVSIFSNFLGVAVFKRALLNGYFQCVANAQNKKDVWKFVLRKGAYFVLFLFLGETHIAPRFIFKTSYSAFNA